MPSKNPWTLFLTIAYIWGMYRNAIKMKLIVWVLLAVSWQVSGYEGGVIIQKTF
jgi:hypothetical protein